MDDKERIRLLEEALMPFAKAGTGIDGNWPDDTRGGVPGELPFCSAVYAGHFRRAARLMGLKVRTSHPPGNPDADAH